MSNFIFLAGVGFIAYIVIMSFLEHWCDNSGEIDLIEEERLTKNG